MLFQAALGSLPSVALSSAGANCGGAQAAEFAQLLDGDGLIQAGKDLLEPPLIPIRAGHQLKYLYPVLLRASDCDCESSCPSELVFTFLIGKY
jgi:hypothetical protein